MKIIYTIIVLTILAALVFLIVYHTGCMYNVQSSEGCCGGYPMLDPRYGIEPYSIFNSGAVDKVAAPLQTRAGETLSEPRSFGAPDIGIPLAADAQDYLREDDNPAGAGRFNTNDDDN
jgi:hypothetical protein